MSKYRGVSWHKSRNKWQARIQYDQRHIGHFEDEEQAARAYDRAARTNKGEKAQLNFPTKKEKAHATEDFNFPAVGESEPSQSSKYRGVCWNKKSKKWKVTIRYGGKKHRIGSFGDEEEAANAYDRGSGKGILGVLIGEGTSGRAGTVELSHGKREWAIHHS
jgi:hypothetical protein